MHSQWGHGQTSRAFVGIMALAVVSLSSIAALGCGGGGGHGGGGGGSTTSTVSASKSTVVASVTSGTGATVPADGTTGIPITVTIEDSNGNPIANAVVVAQGSGTDTFISYSGITNASGVVTLTITSTKAQTETISVTAYQNGVQVGTPLTQTVTVTFSQIPTGVTGSSITASPTSVTADGSTAATITVTILDANGVAVPNASVTFTASSGSVALNPSTPVTTNASGQASVALTSKTAQSGVTVTAVATLTGSTATVTLTSPAITFVPGAATSLTFESPPTFVAGVPNTLVADIVDAQGNVVTSASNEVVLDQQVTNLGTNPANFVFSGPQTNVSIGNTIVVAQNGKAVFSGLVLDLAGSYTTTAVATGLSSGSTSFTVNSNVGVSLGFVSGPINNNSTADNKGGQPGTVVSGTAFSPVVEVAAFDAFGNIASSLPTGSTATTITLATSNGSTTTLTGANVTNVTLPTSFPCAVKFTGLVATGAATGITLQLTTNNASLFSGSTFPVSSDTFSVLAATGPCALVITANGPLGTGTTTLPTVTLGATAPTYYVNLVNNAGAPQTTSNGVSVTINAHNPANQFHGAVSFTTNPVSIATGSSFAQFTPTFFTALTGYTFSTTNTGDGSNPITDSTSPSFTVFPGPAAQLYYTTRVTPTTNQSPVPIVAKNDYFSGSAAIGVSFPVRVSVFDSHGNLCSSGTNAYTGNVSLALGGTSPAGLTLTGGGPVAAVAGNATFTVTLGQTGGTPTLPATGAELVASATAAPNGSSIPNYTSNGFNVVAGSNYPAGLKFLTSIANTVAGAELGAPTEIQVQVVDGAGNAVTGTMAQGFTIGLSTQDFATPDEGNYGSVNVGVSTGGGTAPSVSGGSSATTDLNGIARFVGPNMTLATVGCRVVAEMTASNSTSANLTEAVSNTFDIAAASINRTAGPFILLGPSSGQVLTLQPTPATATSTAAIAPVSAGNASGVPYIQERDYFGNVVTTFTGTVNVSIYPGTPTTNGPGGKLGGTTSVNWVSGNAIFPNLTIGANTSTPFGASGYELNFSAVGTGLPDAHSNTFSTQ